MENRIVTQEEIGAIPQTSMGQAIEISLTEKELHALVQFFQLLDRWDREVVQ